jgi:hypothetical protein
MSWAMIRVLRLLRAAAGSDQDLLDWYVRNRDEEAFAELVRRDGGVSGRRASI